MKVLLIEDDPHVSEFVERHLLEVGHDVSVAYNGTEGLRRAQNETYDVLVLDRMLPEIDGVTIAQTLKDAGNLVPILIISALGDVDNRVLGLQSGADDYLVKPFAFSELLARIEVLGRRAVKKSEDISKICVQDVEIDLISRRVTRGSQLVDLQAREFKLLEYMVRNKGQLITRTMLLENVWDYKFDPQTNIIDVHISRLRNKLEKDFEKPIIRTVRGSGYIIED